MERFVPLFCTPSLAGLALGRSVLFSSARNRTESLLVSADLDKSEDGDDGAIEEMSIYFNLAIDCDSDLDWSSSTFEWASSVMVIGEPSY